MSANPPSPTPDRARVEAVRATLLEAACYYDRFATHVDDAPFAAALREAATWAPPAKERDWSEQRSADRLAAEVKRLVERGVIDARSPAGDALLDYADVRHGSTNPIGAIGAPPGDEGLRAAARETLDSLAVLQDALGDEGQDARAAVVRRAEALILSLLAGGAAKRETT